MSEFSMFDLFRQEVETHVAALRNKLPELEKAPGATTTLEELMRAAHSIKGAARIVDVPPAAALAETLETCFVAAQQKRLVIAPADFPAILQAADLLAAIGALKAEEVDGWSRDRNEAVEQALQEIRQIGTRAPAAAAPAPVVAVAPPVAAPPMVKIADTSMLDLFLQEAQTHAASLNEGLLELEKDPAAAGRLVEPLMRAAHSIKGAARIIGLPIVVELAHAMEDGFVAAQQGRFAIEPAVVDLLLEAVDLFAGLGEQRPEKTESWLNERAADFVRLTTATRQCQTPGGTPPARPVAPQPEEKPAAQPVQGSAKESSPSPEGAETAARRDVQVSADILDRLMGLAGESLVESRRLGAFVENLLQMKKSHNQLVLALEGLRDELVDDETAGRWKTLGLNAAHLAKQGQELLGRYMMDFENFSLRTDDLANRLYDTVLASRMRPSGDGVKGFPRMVRDLARELGKKISFEIIGEGTPVDREILEKLQAPLNHLLRNAVDHGLEPPEERYDAGKPPEGKLTLTARHHAGMLNITVADDGRGINLEKVRQRVIERKMLSEEMARDLTEAELLEFLLLPGFTTTNKVTRVSGRGVGLDVVHSMVQELRGVVRMESRLGEGTAIHLKLPLSLSVIRVLLVECGGEKFAIPLNRIEGILAVPVADIHSLENRQYITVNGEHIGLIPGHQLFELEEAARDREHVPVVVLRDAENSFGLTVDALLEERDLAIRPLDSRLGKVQDVNAAALLEDGSVVLILDVDDLVRSIDNLLSGGRLKRVRGAIQEGRRLRKQVLVVDDSITVREMQRHLLENKGYEVKTAVDGVDGWNAVRADKFELIISDVDMPRMNGIELVRHIKQNQETKNLPVIIVSYKDREEDRKRGLEAGADYYLTKSSFHDATYLEAIVDLIGEA